MSSRSRRLLYRLTHARQQLRYSLITPVLGLTASVAFAIAGRVSTDDMLASLAAESPLETGLFQSLSTYLHSVFGLIIVSALVVAVTQTFVCILWSRRVFGPEIPFLNHLRALRAGDYSSRVTLRHNDEFQKVADELNALAAGLEASK